MHMVKLAFHGGVYAYFRDCFRDYFRDYNFGRQFSGQQYRHWNVISSSISLNNCSTAIEIAMQDCTCGVRRAVILVICNEDCFMEECRMNLNVLHCPPGCRMCLGKKLTYSTLGLWNMNTTC